MWRLVSGWSSLGTRVLALLVGAAGDPSGAGGLGKMNRL